MTGNRCHSDSPQAACINGPRQRTATPISTLNGPNRVSHPASKGEGRTRKRQHLQIQQQEEQQQQRGDLGTTGGNSLEGERQPKKMKQEPQKPQQQQLGVMGPLEGDSMMLQQLPTRRKNKHGAQELQKCRDMRPKGSVYKEKLSMWPPQPWKLEQDVKWLQQMGYIVPNGGGSVEQQLQPHKMKHESQQLGVMGPTEQIKQEAQEPQQLGVLLWPMGSVYMEQLPMMLPQGPPQPRQFKLELQTSCPQIKPEAPDAVIQQPPTDSEAGQPRRVIIPNMKYK